MDANPTFGVLCFAPLPTHSCATLMRSCGFLSRGVTISYGLENRNLKLTFLYEVERDARQHMASLLIRI